ncbi:MAG: acyl-CoA dehydrogenase [Proteobacteria bacterium]|nr:acyl-CoA dehydrogenase [Pseudomonadota bacterium]
MGFQWNDMHLMVRDMMKKFCADELVPHLDALDTEQMLAYPIMRKMFDSFGIAEMSMGQFRSRLAKDRAKAAGEPPKEKAEGGGGMMGMSRGDVEAMEAIPTIELSRHCPGLVTALGVSVGLTAEAINGRGTFEQRERWVPDLLTLEKIGAWAITEPGAGSDAFGSMRCTARQDGDSFVLNGQKTFITNGPHAETIVFICKLDNGDADWKRRPVLTFVLDGDTPGLVRGPAFRKMGMHSSPTGELFLQDVRVGMDRLLGESVEAAAAGGRSGAKDTFGKERTGVTAMALGMVEQCLEVSVDYARTRRQFGQRIGDFQLIQRKLAIMEVARVNMENMLFRAFDNLTAGRKVSFAAASASKLYCAQACMDVCLEAVQLMGGYGYMAEYRVEQLARDAKVLQIYGGTDEIQMSQVARSLLGPDAG